MDKIDLFKTLKAEFAKPTKPKLVQTTDAVYLAVTGRGEPDGDAFQDGVAALYAMAYTVKMTRKAEGLQDYVVCKLEAEWWGDDATQPLAEVPKTDWNWRLSIRTPSRVEAPELARAAAALLDKGKTARVKDVHLHACPAHTRGQMLHVGPYEREGETFDRITAFLASEGQAPGEPCREIYLNDPRRTDPEKLKTILCLPMAGE